MALPVKESISAAVALAVAGLGYLQWKRSKPSGRAIKDRKAAYDAVGQALEDIHLYVRPGQIDPSTLEGLVKNANTLMIQHERDIADEDKQLAATYLSSVKLLTLALAQVDDAAPARQQLSATGAKVSVPSALSAAYEGYSAARSATMKRFRRTLDD